MVEISKFVLFAAVVALWTPIHILLKWKYTEDKNYAIFAAI